MMLHAELINARFEITQKMLTSGWSTSKPSCLLLMLMLILMPVLMLLLHAQLVNARFEIIQKMLNIWSEHSQRTHISRLDAVIVLLVLIEVRGPLGGRRTRRNPGRWHPGCILNLVILLYSGFALFPIHLHPCPQFTPKN